MDDRSLIEALLREGFSRKTVSVYLATIRRAERQLAAHGWSLGDVGALELAKWVEEDVPSSRASRALARSALTAYWRVTERPDGPAKAIPVPRRPRMRCRALSEADAAALARVALARAQAGTRKGLAVLLGLYGGLRRFEISDLRWSDVSADGWLTVVGKGVERSIPLHPVLRAALAAGGESSSRRRPERVFVGLRGGRLHPTTVWTWVRELAGEAGLRPVATHVLRHTALATALDATRDLRAVQELAGHARPETTAGYTRVSSDRLRETVAAIRYGT